MTPDIIYTMPRAAEDAIKFALNHTSCDGDAMAFLRMWNEGAIEPDDEFIPWRLARIDERTKEE